MPSPHFSHSRCSAPGQRADREGEGRRAMWDIGQAVRRTLSARSPGPPRTRSCRMIGIRHDRVLSPLIGDRFTTHIKVMWVDRAPGRAAAAIWGQKPLNRIPRYALRGFRPHLTHHNATQSVGSVRNAGLPIAQRMRVQERRMASAHFSTAPDAGASSPSIVANPSAVMNASTASSLSFHESALNSASLASASGLC